MRSVVLEAFMLTKDERWSGARARLCSTAANSTQEGQFGA